MPPKRKKSAKGGKKGSRAKLGSGSKQSKTSLSSQEPGKQRSSEQQRQSRQIANPGGGGEADDASPGTIVLVIWFVTAVFGFLVFVCAAMFLDFLVGSLDLQTRKGFCSRESPVAHEMFCVLPVGVSSVFMIVGLAQFAIALAIAILTITAMMDILGAAASCATPFLLHIIFFGVSIFVALIHIIQQIRVSTWKDGDSDPVTAAFFFFITTTATETQRECDHIDPSNPNSPKNCTETKVDQTHEPPSVIIRANFALASFNAVYCLVIAILNKIGKI